MTANDLCAWLREFGGRFGWQASGLDLTAAQQRANDGRVVIITASGRRHGHLTVVVPEISTISAQRHDGQVFGPLQSQAGAINRRYQTTRWWEGQGMGGMTTWWHD